MRTVATTILLGGLAVSGCVATGPGPDGDAAVAKAEIGRLMLADADPAQAAAYFQARLRAAPDDAAARRGLAQSLGRAGRTEEALAAWTAISEDGGTTAEDAVGFAEALIRARRVDEAKRVLDSVPPMHATYDRYRLEAIVADHRRDWEAADAFYETAAALAEEPASILNNWGFSKLTRGDSRGAERLFTEAITQDATLFTAKNNLVLARARRGVYALPRVPATAEERAQMMLTAAKAAMRGGDTDIARELLQRAVETHPRHFPAATKALEGLSA